MCVFKYHAFIFSIRPPRWQSETTIFDGELLSSISKADSFGVLMFLQTFKDKVQLGSEVDISRKIISKCPFFLPIELKRKEYSAKTFAVKKALTLQKKINFYTFLYILYKNINNCDNFLFYVDVLAFKDNNGFWTLFSTATYCCWIRIQTLRGITQMYLWEQFHMGF